VLWVFFFFQFAIFLLIWEYQRDLGKKETEGLLSQEQKKKKNSDQSMDEIYGKLGAERYSMIYKNNVMKL
jgi:hypothetical protein